MKHYQIAYFTTEWNYELMFERYRGIERYTKEHDNVTVCAFDCFGKAGRYEMDDGEYAIFDLPELSVFDGILLQYNQIAGDEVRKQLCKRLKKTGIPIIALEEYVDGLAYYGVDNQAAMASIVEHVIKVHGAKTITYLDGLTSSFEARQRKQAYLDACDAYNIEPDVIPGTWETEAGRTAARELIQRGESLPDALICANDIMAIGACEVLKNEGFRIPEDIIVTGFDNSDSAALHDPRITTLERPYCDEAYHALGKLISMIEKEDVEEVSYEAFRPVFSSSCGCSSSASAEDDTLRSQYFDATRSIRNFYFSQEQMASALLDANGLRETVNAISQHFSSIGCEHAYICINENYAENYRKTQWMRTKDFDDVMILFTHTDLIPKDPGGHQHPHFKRKDLLPGGLLRNEKLIIFYPLHYKHYIIGYIGINLISATIGINLEYTFSMINSALEDVRKRAVLEELNKVLEDLYVMDPLTGLYNRFGMESFGSRIYENLISQGKTVSILFIDMDDMKDINDTFGHETGDAAIKATADVLVRSCSRSAFLMRFGGDEFIVISADDGGDTADKIKSNVSEYNRTGRSVFTLSLSIGTVTADKNDHLSLEKCITAADKKMYEDKTRRKAGREQV
ncbi:MAG: GGDEF domain-containing protein [Lachnospiraceae bacterium]|nr:GGDEF domain-containing protein [Lachnospiraceae bacterium]